MTQARRVGQVATVALAALLLGLVGVRTVSMSVASPPDAGGIETLMEARGLETVPVRGSLASVPTEEADGAGLVVVGSGRGFSNAEVSRVQAFVEAGGRVLVLGARELPGTFGVPLASTAASTVRPDPGVPARAQVGTKAFELVLPAAIPVLDTKPGGPVTVRTTNVSYLDLDGDGHETGADAGGPFLVSRRAGDGRVLVVSAPGLASQAALQQADNRAFLEALLDEHMPAVGPVYLDRARAAGPFQAPLAGLLAVLAEPAEDPRWGVPLTVAGLVAIGAHAWAALAPRRREDDLGLDEPVPWPGEERA